MLDLQKDKVERELLVTGLQKRIHENKEAETLSFEELERRLS